jgi:hypothetical protein
MTKNEALRMGMDALVSVLANHKGAPVVPWNDALDGMKAALEAKDEPVAYINVEQRKLEWAKYMSWDTPTVVNLPKIPLYTTPPQRTWVGLTYEDMVKLQKDLYDAKGESVLPTTFAMAVEAKLKEKNNG